MKLIKFLKFKYYDTKIHLKLKKDGIVPFNEYGMTVFSGRQGAGKTMSLVKVANDYRNEYPNLFIASNFGYKYDDMALRSFQDILQVIEIARSKGTNGILILWDEIQNDVDSFTKTPKEILTFITQQRKQGIKILATSQVFTRVSKAIREQTYEVVECKTFASRWTFTRWYDASEYTLYHDNPERRKKFLNVRKRLSFIQDHEMRECYDSYLVIDTLTQKMIADQDKNIIAIGVEL